MSPRGGLSAKINLSVMPHGSTREFVPLPARKLNAIESEIVNRVQGRGIMGGLNQAEVSVSNGTAEKLSSKRKGKGACDGHSVTIAR